jgi:hypothetical protein
VATLANIPESSGKKASHRRSKVADDALVPDGFVNLLCDSLHVVVGEEGERNVGASSIPEVTCVVFNLVAVQEGKEFVLVVLSLVMVPLIQDVIFDVGNAGLAD